MKKIEFILVILEQVVFLNMMKITTTAEHIAYKPANEIKIWLNNCDQYTFLLSMMCASIFKSFFLFLDCMIHCKIIFQSIVNGLLGVNGAHALNLVELDKSRNLDQSWQMPKMVENNAWDLICKQKYAQLDHVSFCYSHQGGL